MENWKTRCFETKNNPKDMTNYIITHREMERLLADLLKDLPVMGPRCRPKAPETVIFDWLEKPSDWVPEYTTTDLPPKKGFFPPEETVFTYREGDPPELSSPEIEPFVLLEQAPLDLRPQKPAVPKAGRGVGVVEAPRGTLFHEYEFDGNGICTYANQLIPTAQNLGSINADLADYVTGISDGDDREIRLGMEMLVRAYDPCISCSTHTIRLDSET